MQGETCVVEPTSRLLLVAQLQTGALQPAARCIRHPRSVAALIEFPGARNILWIPRRRRTQHHREGARISVESTAKVLPVMRIRVGRTG
eukprot:s4356_g7.t1